MAIYTISTNPKNISGLQFWLDASDQSSINLYKTTIGSYSAANAGVTYSGTDSGPGVDWKNGTSVTSVASLTYSSWSQSSVLSMTDKQSGIVISATAGYGTGTPKYLKYDYNSVNSKNSIILNRLANGEMSLVNTNIVSTFNSLTHSLYFVFATGYTYSTISQYGSYMLSIFRNTRTSTGGYPNIAIGILNSGSNTYYYNIETQQTSTTTTPFSSFTFIDRNNSKSIIFSTRLNGSSLPDPVRVNLIGDDVNNKFFGLTGTPGSGSTKATTGVTVSNAKFILGDYWIGSYATTSNPSPPIGRFCEMLYYNQMLSDTDNDKVVQYLKNKWVNPESPIQYIQPVKFYKTYTTGAGSGQIVPSTTSYEYKLTCTSVTAGRYGNGNISGTSSELPLLTGTSLFNTQLYAKIEVIGTSGYTVTQRGFAIWLGSNGGYFSTTRPPDIYIPPGFQGVYETNCYWGGSTSSAFYYQFSNEDPAGPGKTWSGVITIQLGSTQYGL
jgi:hypothetical protein